MSEELPRVRDSVLAKALDQGNLLFPGADVDHPEEESIEKLNKDELKKLCDKYGLARSGNKNDLKTRLKGLSASYCANPQLCIDSRKPRKARKHKGPREQPNTSSAKPKKKTGASTLAARRLALMNTNVAGAGERSKDMRTQDDIAALTLWTKGNIARFSYTPPTKGLATVSAKAGPSRTPTEPESATTTTLLHSIAFRLGEMLDLTRPSNVQNMPPSTIPRPQPLVALAEPAFIRDTDMFPANSTDNRLDTESVSAALTSVPSASTASTSGSSAPAPRLDVASPLFPADVPIPDVPTPDVPMPDVPMLDVPMPDVPTSDVPLPDASFGNTLMAVANSGPAVVAGVAPGPKETRMRSLKLGDGAIISFDLNQIRPPVLNFSGANLPRLWQEWDDTRPEWDSSSSFIIDGKAIALKYMHQIFVNSGSWDKHKAKWNDWKHLTTAYFKTTPEQFWARFSDESGTRLAYTKLVKALRQERMQLAKTIANRARTEYQDEFKLKFTYRKGSQTRLMDKDDAIAKKYLQLRPDALPNVSVDDFAS